MEQKKVNSKITLFQWIWRSYFKTSLVPLLVVEMALIGAYFLSNQFSNKENIKTIETVAEQQLLHLAQREADGINQQLEGIAQATRYLQNYTTQVMAGKNLWQKDDAKRFSMSKDGVFYTTKDTGGSAVFYSGFISIGEKEKQKAFKSAALDPALIAVKEAFSLIGQSYFNTFDSLNRIYPYFDVISQYPPKMDIPSYNFYYEADLQHNPSRGVVWTDAYIDPAGQGWMTTAAAPVYSLENPDFLEGVVGVDITIKTIVDKVKALQIPWKGYGVLMDKNGVILALPSVGGNDWNIHNMTDSEYTEAIKHDTFRSDDYNLYLKKPDVAQALKTQNSDFSYTKLTQDSILAWATVPETNWKLLVVVPTATIFEPSNALSARLNNIAWLMIAGMLAFYSVFFTMLYRQSKKMSFSLSEPLHNMDEMVSQIAQGKQVSSNYDFAVQELDSTATGILDMGNQLESAKRARELAAAELQKRSEQLQMVFDVSPSGYLLVSAEHKILLVNKVISELINLPMANILQFSDNQFWETLSTHASEPICAFENPEKLYRVELLRPRQASLLCAMREIYLPSGELLGKLYFLHDVTKEEEASRIKNEFLMHATHELRTPLSTIHGYTELLKGGMIPQEMQPEIIGMIHEQSTWLITMITELLDLSRIEERAGADFVIEPYSLNELLNESVSEFTIPENRSPIIYAPLENELTLNVDKEKFKRVLHCILDNAYKYSPDGGDVQIALHQNDNLKFIEIEVIDAGLGLSKEEIPKVFDRFYRVDKSGNIAGAGLGLSLAKEIMTLLDGEIRIESSPNQGSHVFIRFNLR